MHNQLSKMMKIIKIFSLLLASLVNYNIHINADNITTNKILKQSHAIKNISNELFIDKDINNSLSLGYMSNQNILSKQIDFLDKIESFPSALANYFMPKITSKITNQRTLHSRPQIAGSDSSIRKTITFNQPIFRGGAGYASLKSAINEFHFSRFDYFTNEQNIIMKMIDTYLSTLLAKEKMRIAETSLTLSQTSYNAQFERFKVGESTSTDVATAQSNLAKAKANKASIKAEYTKAKSEFYKTFGIDDDNVTMPDIDKLVDQKDDIETFLYKVRNNNPQIIASKFAVKVRKNNANVARASIMPRADFVIEVARNTPNQEDITLNQVKSDTVTSQISLEIPILSAGGANHINIRRSKGDIKRSMLNHIEIEKTIISQAKTNIEVLNSGKSRLKAAKKTLEAAKIAYDGMVQEEKLGSKTILDVLQSEENLVKAEESLVESKIFLLKTNYERLSLMGKMTAKEMNLNVSIFDPEKEFRKRKFKVIGFY
ncbi:MAG TPA: TolC family protein [Candidatus Megaira endosymbiont of Hartmannula sinica]|nr:TolC family protein [Candidatus Megaera endosymbiont of Hartmannula sinica]